MFKRWMGISLALATMAVVVSVGCGGGGGSSSSGGGGGGVSVGSFTIPTAGGTASTDGGVISITAPAGAVGADSLIQATTASGIPSDPTVITSTAFTFTSTSFNYPVVLSLQYDPAQIPTGGAENNLEIVKLINNAWTPMPTSVNTTTHVATANITSFSTYAVAVSRSLVTAEATLDGSGNPAIRVTPTAANFTLGSSSFVQWQYTRNTDSIPSGVITQSSGAFLDTQSPSSINYASGLPTAFTCIQSTLPSTAATPTAPTKGAPTYYSANLIYKVNSLDLPNGFGSIGACTAAVPAHPKIVFPKVSGDAYFSSLPAVSGLATALEKPSITSPAASAVVGSTFTLTVSPPASAGTSSIDYIVEGSTEATFNNASLLKVIGSPYRNVATGPVSIPVDISAISAWTSGTTLYFRVGARNAVDYPGPVADAIGQRAIFSDGRSFVR